MYYGKYEGHTYAKCTDHCCDTCGGAGFLPSQERPCAVCGGAGHHGCTGCRAEGLDCMFDSLAYCTVCGGFEGALLPTCPGRKLTPGEHDQNYKDYCAGAGPFAENPQT